MTDWLEEIGERWLRGMIHLKGGDVPTLIDEVRKLRAENNEYRSVMCRINGALNEMAPILPCSSLHLWIDMLLKEAGE